MYNLIRDKIIEILESLNYANGAAEPQIAIVPYGCNGLLCKQILNEQFGIEEAYLADNMLCKYSEKILSVEELKKKDLSGVTVFLNATNPAANHQLEKQILETEKEIKLVNILTPREPVVISSPHKKDYFHSLRNLISIKEVCGYELVRVGKNNDGGYIMIDDFTEDMRAYSFGISNDMSWDMWVSRRSGMDVFMYDHTIMNAPENDPKCHFFKMGVGADDNPDKRIFSLNTFLKNNGDENNENLILKMDIEGAEWEILEQISREDLMRFKQISFELHDMANSDRTGLILKCMKKLTKTHQIIWMHGNNYSHAEECDGIVIPVSLEMTFARRDSYKFTDKAVKLPLHMDMPNCPTTKDFELGCWS